MIIEKTSRIGFLDGLRGFAALWVFVAHATIFSGSKIQVLSAGNAAVDVFMMVSGFLMMHNALERRNAEPWENIATWCRFILRRFFRIAPVYYVVLLLGLLLAHVYGGWRAELAQFFDDPAVNLPRFTEQTFTNVLTHITFLFGLLPEYAHQSPGLPDWSIGLEMQYYVFLPLILLASSMRGGLYAVSLIAVALCWSLWVFAADFLSAFTLPSFLTLKLHMFLIGMILAQGSVNPRSNILLRMCWVLILATVPLETGELHRQSMLRYSIVIMMFVLSHSEAMPKAMGISKVVNWATGFLSNKFCSFMADMSYAVYLLHIFILVPIAIWVLHTFGHEGNGYIRLVVSLVLSIPPTYLAAWFVHKTIEKYGIAIGRKLAKKI